MPDTWNPMGVLFVGTILLLTVGMPLYLLVVLIKNLSIDASLRREELEVANNPPVLNMSGEHTGLPSVSQIDKVGTLPPASSPTLDMGGDNTGLPEL